MPAHRLPSGWARSAACSWQPLLPAAGRCRLGPPKPSAYWQQARLRALCCDLSPPSRRPAAAKFDVVFDTVGALRDRVLGGDAADVVILSEAGLAALEKAGKIAGPAVDLGSISVALAMRKGAQIPDITSPEALKQALLAANSDCACRSCGAVLPRRSRRGSCAGRFEIGVSQSSEIVAHPGVTLVGACLRLCPPHTLSRGQAHWRRGRRRRHAGTSCRPRPRARYSAVFGFEAGQ